jgi:hypothetical protein
MANIFLKGAPRPGKKIDLAAFFGPDFGRPDAPPSAGVPQRGPGKWNMPDYNALIAGDPTLMGAIAQIKASGAASGREKINAVRRAAVNFGGELPAGAAGLGDIDEATRIAARDNPLSTVRQQDEARGRNRADLLAALAGRGMVSSGALTGGENQIQQGYERSRGTATQQLLDALSGYETSHAQAQRELALAEMEARESAASRVMSSYSPFWSEGDLIGAPANSNPTVQMLPTAPPNPFGLLTQEQINALIKKQPYSGGGGLFKSQ